MLFYQFYVHINLKEFKLEKDVASTLMCELIYKDPRQKPPTFWPKTKTTNLYKVSPDGEYFSGGCSVLDIEKDLERCNPICLQPARFGEKTGNVKKGTGKVC